MQMQTYFVCYVMSYTYKNEKWLALECKFNAI